MPIQVWQAAGIASVFALLMVLHVFAWFMIGVVMAPTYILLLLGSTCLFANLGLILLPERAAGLYETVAWIKSRLSGA